MTDSDAHRWRSDLRKQEVRVPAAKEPFGPVIAGFALTYDGYAREEPDEIRSDVQRDWRDGRLSQRPLEDLRCALFMVQRRWRWSDESEPTGEDRCFIEALLDAIRIASGGWVIDEHPAV